VNKQRENSSLWYIHDTLPELNSLKFALIFRLRLNESLPQLIVEQIGI